MTIDDFLQRFPHKTPTDGQWLVTCSAHDDRKASLAVREGAEGRILLKCHAGCTTDAILQAMHLRPADLFAARENGHRREVVAYDYTDERGTVLCQAVRFEPKDFRQRRPDGAGGWIWNLKGVRRVPYRLHKLQGRRGIVVAEGEKDVDALWSIGIPATCNVGGAGKWRDSDTQALVAAGIRRVTVIPDNDDPGRQHAADVARACHAAGLEVRVLTLPDVPVKGDVSDYLQSHSKDDLVALATAARVYTPTAAPVPGLGTAGLGPVVVCVADVQSERVSWLWRRRLARGKLTLLMGDPGVGKSFITVDIASRVTRAVSWPDGGHLEHPGNVLFLAVEDGVGDTIRPRLERAGADLRRVFVFTTIRGEDGERLPNFERDMAALEQEIARLKPALVVVDPISSYLGKTDSYKDADVRRVLAPLAVVAEKHRVAVLTLVHMTKGSKEGKALYRAMASIAFSAIARIHLAAGSDPEQPDRCFLMPVKQNICPASETLAYRLAPDPDDEDGAAMLEWEAAPVDGIRADAILGAGTSAGEREQQQDAAEFLQQLLSDGRMRAEEVFQAGKSNGYSEATLNRAKKRAGVKACKAGFRGGWSWELDPKIAPKITIHGDVTTFGENSAVSLVPSITSSKIVTDRCLTTFAGEDDGRF